MKPYYQDESVQIYQGDVRKVLRELPDESVHCCVTSPPYWGLRDYGVDGQIGLEDSPVKYISVMREVFSEVRRVLRVDGTLWLNMGDSYAGSAQGWGHDKQYAGPKQFTNKGSLNQPAQIAERIGFDRPPGYLSSRNPETGLKPKDLVGVPWMLAFALREDGWYLRQDIIWAKPNPMPESVTDRCTKSHEYIFLLSKSERYYYNQEAIKEESVYPDDNRKARANADDYLSRSVEDRISAINPLNAQTYPERNRRSVWQVTTQPFPEAHFATFPQDLIKPCILAGCPEGGTVLDPFMGSGTTGLVAKSLHCKAIGIELNPAYIEIAAKRLSQEVFNFSEAGERVGGSREP